MPKFLSLMKRLFLDNLPLKVVALVMAMILVVVAREETTKVVEVEVPLVVRTLSPDRILVSEAPGSIKLRVRASVQKLSEILAYKKPYEIEFSATGLSQTIYFLPEEFELHFSGGVRVLSVSPTYYEAQFDELRSKEVPVVLNLVKEPGANYVADRDAVRIAPDRVMVTGGSKALEAITQVITQPVDLSGAKETYQADVSLQKPNGVELRTALVRVAVPISQRMSSKTLRGVAMTVRNCPKGFVCKSTPSHFAVQLDGPKQALDALSDEHILDFIYVDGSKLDVRADEPIRNFPAVEPTVAPPEGVHLQIVGAKFFNILVERR